MGHFPVLTVCKWKRCAFGFGNPNPMEGAVFDLPLLWLKHSWAEDC